ncbi:ATP-binding protein [Gillisia sp. M10.2A]|uniref:histidine kinase n=1 Tax=Gillisia lutea TaxID=2909668 RepID=A0ABS9EIA0_9FLAO|nr:ATP-binding protein [Gillisia lutea]MCF4101919.1 ATP-binding protein [Gillisia lutea]
MKIADVTLNENDRLKALKTYSILDTLPEQDFEDITKIASEICQTPISLISLVDENRQWFKSHRGLNINQTPRHFSFCSYAINEKDTIMIVPDSRLDSRFSNNPLVTGEPHIVFYAGVPLRTNEGFSLGTICVIDNEPRKLSQSQLNSLESLSKQVVKLLELKKANHLLFESKQELEKRNVELEKFAYMVSHDIKSPLNKIISLTNILSNQQEVNEQERRFIINNIENSTIHLKGFIDGIIKHYRGVNAPNTEVNQLTMASFIDELILLVDPARECKIYTDLDCELCFINSIALKQILLNILSNAIKYNDKPEVIIWIKVSEDNGFYNFSIEDNGIGIDPTEFDKIFETFTTLGKIDRFQNYGSGIGLSTVKKIVEKLGGEIQVNSKVGEGSAFNFTIRK